VTAHRALDPADVVTTPTRTLLRVQAAALTELIRRGVVRTRNAPAGDLAETLVARAYAGTLAPPSEKSWDVEVPDGRRLQVKCRLVGPAARRGQRGLSPFRSFEFDAAVIVLLDELTFDVERAVEVPVSVIQDAGHHVPWVNGFRVRASAELLDHPSVVDVTERIQAAVLGLDDFEGARGAAC
jgi:hypothetical protein